MGHRKLVVEYGVGRGASASAAIAVEIVSGWVVAVCIGLDYGLVVLNAVQSSSVRLRGRRAEDEAE